MGRTTSRVAVAGRARAALVGAISLLMVVPPVVAAPVRGPKVLAGTTSIKGAKASVARVHLPADAWVRVRPPAGSPEGAPIPGIRIEGSGRIAGFYLTEPNPDFGSTYLAAFQFRFDDRSYEYVYSSGFDAATGGEHEHPDAIELPAGDYLLHLVSEGAPVEVRLELEGLRGKTTIRPSAPAGSGFSMPDAENSTSVADGKAFWYGHEATLTGQGGLYVGAMRLDLKSSTHLRVGLCISEDTTLPAQVRDAPYCPGGYGAAEERTEVVPVDREVVKPWLAFVDSPGTYSFAQHYSAVYTEAEVDSISFHLDVGASPVR